MPYRVEFPPDIEKSPETSSGLSLPKNTGDSGDKAITGGRIIAVKICSTVLDADIWLAFRDDFKPDADEPLAIYYADELQFLSTKDAQTLREIQKVKLAFPGSKVRQ